MQLSMNQTKAATLFVTVLLAAFVMLVAKPTQAQMSCTNLQADGSIPLPASVAPDVPIGTYA
jgi:hypothetical protein